MTSDRLLYLFGRVSPKMATADPDGIAPYTAVCGVGASARPRQAKGAGII